MKGGRGFAIRGDAFHTPRRGVVEPLPDALIEVSATGVIERVTPGSSPDHAGRIASARAAGPVIALPPRSYLIPGMVDLHVHAPQWPQLGRALDVPLEVWLQRHTFPLEARYADLDFAREVYASLVEALLARGTTTAVYFATVHLEASVALAETCLAKGQRAVVGKVAMDHPDECPPWYRDADARAAEADTRAFIDRVRALQPDGAPLVLPAVTPRFLPSCTDPLLQALGRVAAETGCHVQTHCSESDWEVAHTRARFGETDLEALERLGLLSTRAILAHCNFVTAQDRAAMRRAGAAMAHCPLSNLYFAGAVAPVRAALDEGLNVGLGTDISGGHSASLLDNARWAAAASRALDQGVDPALAAGERGVPGSAITIAEAFWMATAGGGEALGLPVGTFARGQAFDAVAVAAPAAWFLASPDPPLPDLFETLVRRAERSDLAAVWVAGRQVAGRSDFENTSLHN